MASNVNVLLILTLAFYVSSGSLLLSSSLRPAQGLQEHHLEEHQYRQSRIPKRQNFFEENAADRWLLYEKDEDGKEGLPSFGGKRYQRFEKAGNRPPWRKRNHPDEDDSGGDTLKVSDHTSKSYASQHMLRTPRNHRTYDVPQIGRDTEKEKSKGKWRSSIGGTFGKLWEKVRRNRKGFSSQTFQCETPP
ncbi:hypothetical protein RUM43_010992 [Polyplax serrata]|uniref:Uncharacterized protein n=1 Tax=Polyplax serrata TaxID=468196 RepID=A0AAN8P8F0_POLSC